MRPNEHPFIRLVAIVFVATGMLMASDGLYIWSKAAYGQMLLEKSWERTLVNSRPDKPWSWADISALIRMNIPHLNHAAVVLDGANGEALAWGPGHMPGTPLPGDPGISIIAGHRDTHFAVLGKLVVGDDIFIERYDGKQLKFRVRERKVVNANAPDLGAKTEGSVLALVTCWPLDALKAGGDERLVVLADQI